MRFACPPYLVDALLDTAAGAVEAGADTQPFSHNLARFLAARMPAFAGVCTYAACRLQARVARFETIGDAALVVKLRQASAAAHNALAHLLPAHLGGTGVSGGGDGSGQPAPKIPQVDADEEAAALQLLRNQIRALCMLLAPAVAPAVIVTRRLRTTEKYEEQAGEIARAGLGHRPPLAGLTLRYAVGCGWRGRVGNR